MEISHETYSSFLSNLKLDDEAQTKIKSYLDSEVEYESNLPQLTQHVRNFDIRWLQETDLMAKDMFDGELQNDIMMQGVDMMAIYCSEIFEKINNFVEISPNKSTLSNEYSRFKQYFEVIYNQMFAEIEDRNQMLNIYNELLTSTFDWMFVYFATTFSQELFRIVLKSSNIVNSVCINNLLTRVPTGSSSLLTKIVYSSNFKEFIDEIGKVKTVELFFSEYRLILKLINNELFVDTITSSNEHEQQIIRDILLNTKYENGDSFINVVLSNDFTTLNTTVTDAVISSLKPYASLLLNRNNNGFCCMSAISTDLIEKFIKEEILSALNFFTADANNLPSVILYYFVAMWFFNDVLKETPVVDYNEELLKNIISTFSYWMHNMPDTDFNADYCLLDEEIDINGFKHKIASLIKNVHNKHEFMLKETKYCNDKVYPTGYYLFALGIQEIIFLSDTDPSNNELHNACETFLQNYPFLFPSKSVICNKDEVTCFCTIQKLVNCGKTEYVDRFWQEILDNNDYLEDHLICASQLLFLTKSLLILDTSKAPYNILRIFSDFISNSPTPQSTLDSVDDTIFIQITQKAINMYILNDLESIDIAQPLFEWLYQYKRELFVKLLNNVQTWPQYFNNNGTDQNLTNFVTEQILQHEQIPHETIFGTNIDELPTVFTHYSEKNSNIYSKLIEFGHLDTYYSQNFNDIYNLLCLHDTKITRVVSQLPSFSLDIFFENYEDRDLFSQAYDHADLVYCTYILERYEPSLEYKKKFITTLDLTKNLNLICLLIRKSIVNHTTYCTFEDYTNVMRNLITMFNEELISYLINFTGDELLKMFGLDISPNVLELFLGQDNKYINLITNNLNNELFKNNLRMCESNLMTALNKFPNEELLNQLISHNVISLQNLVMFIDLVTKNSHVFMHVLNNNNIVDLLIEEYKLLNKSINESFLIAVFNDDECLNKLFEWFVNHSNIEKVHDLVKYCSTHNFDILNEILTKYTFKLETTAQFVELLLEINHMLISNLMITELIVLDKKDLIIKCVKMNVNIDKENLSMIINKYPECSLLVENTKELIVAMSDENIVLLFKSPCMSSNTQDFILEHLSCQQKFNLMCECVLNTQIGSSFFEKHSEIIQKLIEIDNEVFYSLMKNSICVDQYLLSTDTNGNYMLPFIPDGYVEESLVEKFMSKLTLDDLNKTDKFGRSIFNTFIVNPFLKFLLTLQNINTFYEENLDMLKSVINSIAKDHYELLKNLPNDILNTITNKNGQNILMILIEAGKCDDALDFINNNCGNKQFEHLDNNGNNLLFYSVLQPDIFDEVLKIYVRNYGADCVKVHNKNFETLLMYAIKHGAHNSSFEMLLSSDLFGDEQNYVYNNTGSILTYGSLYLNEQQFDTLLRWQHISKNHLDTTQTFEIYDWFSGDDPLTTKENVRGSLLTIASLKSGSVFKKLLIYYEKQMRSIMMILKKERVLIGNYSYSHMEFTYLYNPESFQHLLGLDFASELVQNHNFFSKNITIQPASWFYYSQSKIYTNTIQDIYKVPYYLRPGPHIQSIAHIVQAKHEPSSSNADICNICNVGRKKIMFGCHLHLACVSCGCVLEKCPECNKRDGDRNNKIKIFN